MTSSLTPSSRWVFSSELSSSERNNHAYYTSSQSTTFQSLPSYTWSISYADGSSASGDVGTDTVTIGSTTVPTQAIELAQHVSESFIDDTSDGLVGLAFSTINTVSPKQQSTFFENAKAGLDAEVFAAYLPFEADGGYDFGFVDDSRYTGDLSYVDVDSGNGWWEFESVEYRVGETTYSQSDRTGIAGMFLMFALPYLCYTFWAERIWK